MQRNLASRGFCNRGFTLTEVIIVIALMGILMAIATPPFLSWRQNMMYKQVAKGITTTLNDAKSRAITQNRQYRLAFDAASRRYTLMVGNRSYGSSEPLSPTGVISSPFAAGIFLNLSGAGTLNVDFYPNGTASGGAIRVTDGTSPRYRIGVERTGRIRSEKVH